METVQKKKRKNLKLKSIELYEVIKTNLELRQALKRVFKYHIGRENAINPNELFKEVIGRDAYTLDVYKRLFWWREIKKAIQDLRHLNQVFVVYEGQILYVLQTEAELKRFNKHVEAVKNGLSKMQDQAKEWVLNQKWKGV